MTTATFGRIVQPFTFEHFIMELELGYNPEVVLVAFLDPSDALPTIWIEHERDGIKTHSSWTLKVIGDEQLVKDRIRPEIMRHLGSTVRAGEGLHVYQVKS